MAKVDKVYWLTTPMSKGDITKRRWEAHMMHRYGTFYLGSIAATDTQFPCVMVGNPDQKIIISVEAP